MLLIFIDFKKQQNTKVIAICHLKHIQKSTSLPTAVYIYQYKLLLPSINIYMPVISLLNSTKYREMHTCLTEI